MALTKIDDRGLTTPIDLLDNEKIRFGTGNDLEIFHDGSQSFIKDTGTGSFKICSNSLSFRNAGDSEDVALFLEDGRTELYYDNSKKFETYEYGVTVTGNVQVGTHAYWGDNGEAIFGDGSDLKIYHNGSASWIKDAGTGGLNILSNLVWLGNAGGTETFIQGTEDGSVQLYWDNSKKFETQSGGAAVTGGLNVSGNVVVPDNSIFIAGTGDDLQIKHDGSNSYLSNTTGHLFVDTTYSTYFRKTGGEEMAVFVPDGGCFLKYDNVTKFETTSTGVKFTGDLRTDDDYRIKLGTSQEFNIYHHNTGSSVIENTNQTLKLRAKEGEDGVVIIPDGAAQLYHDSSIALETTADGISIRDGDTSVQVDLRTSGGTVRGYIYANDSNMVGLLDAGGSWVIQHQNDSHTLFRDNHTERLRIDSDGIKFNGDTAAANGLDDYEEGLWDLTGGSCNIDLHDSYDTGWYVKIGHVVTCGAYVQSDETSTDTAALTFTLPFATSAIPSGGDTGWLGSCSLNSFAISSDITQSSIAAGDAASVAYIRLNGGNAVGWTSLKKSEFTDGKLMQFTLTYKCQ